MDSPASLPLWTSGASRATQKTRSAQAGAQHSQPPPRLTKVPMPGSPSWSNHRIPHVAVSGGGVKKAKEEGSFCSHSSPPCLLQVTDNKVQEGGDL